ncbi:DUF1207 domain-containing protein [Planctomicrobium sp. SH664]|uniref:DUF1207 domain-containing protein n=1 Tax=Planctomicrobium sp. SH664 TaxID=3448125 RepID=UPI003F5B94AF
MVRSQLIALSVLACLGWIGIPSAQADQDWIRAGSFVDWPDSLLSTESPDLTGNGGGTVPAAYAVPPLLPPSEDEEPPQYFQPSLLPVAPAQCAPDCNREWQLLPQGLLYHSYLAGEKEPRFASQWLWGYDNGQRWDMVMGGRLGLIRKGTKGWDAEGFQVDIEGAALGRIDPNEDSDPFEAADYRCGLVFTWREGRWRWKTGFAHLSSHLGDEFLLNNPGYNRLNYVRDSVLAGVTYDVITNLQVYGEIAYALNANGGAEPVELQFGVQYFPFAATGWRGAPFAAANGHLRQEFGMSGSINVEAGWAWRSEQSGHLLRFGLQHYSGPSLQWSFFDQHENLTGIGLWYDF